MTRRELPPRWWAGTAGAVSSCRAKVWRRRSGLSRSESKCVCEPVHGTETELAHARLALEPTSDHGSPARRRAFGASGAASRTGRRSASASTVASPSGNSNHTSGQWRVVESLTDADAIERSRSQPEAFALVFERHFDRVHAYLRARVGDREARELAADTFERAFRSRARYDVTRLDASPWLFAIATNLIRHHRRSEQRRLRALAREPVGESVAEEETVLDRLSAAQQMAMLATGLRALRGDERDVLLLYAWAELSYDEISVALQIPVGTVRSRLSRARARLRKLLPSRAQHGEECSANPKEVLRWTS